MNNGFQVLLLTRSLLSVFKTLNVLSFAESVRKSFVSSALWTNPSYTYCDIAKILGLSYLSYTLQYPPRPV